MKAKAFIAALFLASTALLAAQKETIDGIRNFTKVDVTFACAGATESTALAGLAKRTTPDLEVRSVATPDDLPTLNTPILG